MLIRLGFLRELRATGVRLLPVKPLPSRRRLCPFGRSLFTGLCLPEFHTGPISSGERGANRAGRGFKRPGRCGLSRLFAIRYTLGQVVSTTKRKRLLMGELEQRQWAVLSEDGCEAAGLTYDEALELVRGLEEDKSNGLCIISDEAARRIRQRRKTPANTTQFSG